MLFLSELSSGAVGGIIGCVIAVIVGRKIPIPHAMRRNFG